MMKKLIAFGVALVLLISLTACGSKGDKNPSKDPAVTTTTTVGDGTDGTTTTVADGTAEGDTTTDILETTTVTKQPTATAAPTTQYVTGGTQVPIGTRPPTTTTTKKPTTSVTGNAPSGSGTTTSASATTTTTTTTVKPTTPPADQHYIALPEVGTDIDVTKKKNRIRVSDALAWYNEDGTIGVSLTFKNHTTNWITEETNWVEYTCYDKNGNAVQKERIMIGVIDTKRHSIKTFEFTVPAATVEVKLTRSNIVYWTEWA